MILEKHTIVKEVGTLTYPTLTPVYKDNLGFKLDDKGYCAYDLIFDPPIVVNWKYREIFFMNPKSVIFNVELEYDFGMKCEFLPHQRIIENPSYWEFRKIDLSSPTEDIVKRYVEDQLLFSLTRNPAELSITDWALRGWLQSRTTRPWKGEMEGKV